MARESSCHVLMVVKYQFLKGYEVGYSSGKQKFPSYKSGKLLI
jgi:hypothetical protein